MNFIATAIGVSTPSTSPSSTSQPSSSPDGVSSTREISSAGQGPNADERTSDRSGEAGFAALVASLLLSQPIEPSGDSELGSPEAATPDFIEPSFQPVLANLVATTGMNDGTAITEVTDSDPSNGLELGSATADSTAVHAIGSPVEDVNSAVSDRLDAAPVVATSSETVSDPASSAALGEAAERTARRALPGETDDEPTMWEDGDAIEPDAERLRTRDAAPSDKGREKSSNLTADQLLAARLSDAYRSGEAPLPDDSEAHDAAELKASAAAADASLALGSAGRMQQANRGTVEPRSVANQLAEAIAAQLDQLKESGSLKFEIQLDPPELGQVMVRIERTADTLVAHLMVEDEAVQQLVRQQLQRLHDALNEAGVRLDQFDVSHQHQQPSQQQSRDQSLPSHSGIGLESFPSPSPPTTPTIRLVQGRVDVKA